MIFEIILIILSLAAAGIFRKYFLHVYKVGRENMLKSFSIGFSAVFIFGLIASLGRVSVPEGRVIYLLLLFVLPVIISGYATGCALIAGLAGLDGGRYRFIAITLVGGASAFAISYFPIGGTFIFGGVFVYGLGACLLAFTYPVADEEARPVRQSGPAPVVEQERVGLGGDLSPIYRQDEDAER